MHQPPSSSAVWLRSTFVYLPLSNGCLLSHWPLAIDLLSYAEQRDAVSPLSLVASSLRELNTPDRCIFREQRAQTRSVQSPPARERSPADRTVYRYRKGCG